MIGNGWSEPTGAEIRRFEGHSDSVTSVAFSPDGRQVLTGGWNDSARLWETVSGADLASFEHYMRVISVAFAPDGRSILKGSWDGLARNWPLDVVYWPPAPVTEAE